MDILEHIKELMKKRGINLNQLAKLSNVPQSTLSGLYRRNNVPTIPTLEKICEAFGITITEFFTTNELLTELTEEQRLLLNSWDKLSKKNKEAVLELIRHL